MDDMVLKRSARDLSEGGWISSSLNKGFLRKRNLNAEGLIMEDENIMVPAPQSPRMDKGVLKWFYGDTFAVDMEINLVEQETDEKGNQVNKLIDFGPNDQVVVTFYNGRKEVIHSFICKNISNDNGSENYHVASLEFTKDISHKFHRGKYTYCVRYVRKDENGSVSTDITTICVNNKAEVEICH